VAKAWWRRNVSSSTLTWSDDPDGDGVPLLGEFAFGGSPWFPDAITISNFSNPSQPNVEFTALNPALTALPFTMVASNDLQNWQPIGFEFSYHGPADADYGTHRAVATNPLGDVDHIFMRIQLSESSSPLP